MQTDKSRLDWCLKQTKGIKFTHPSENLTKAYHAKSATALKSMEINAQNNLTEWAVTASYYAKYFAVYSLLCKLGVKCEIHDCTISLFEYLCQGRVPEELLAELSSYLLQLNGLCWK